MNEYEGRELLSNELMTPAHAASLMYHIQQIRRIGGKATHPPCGL